MAYIDQNQHKGIDVIVASQEGYSRQGVELAEPYVVTNKWRELILALEVIQGLRLLP